LTATGAKSGESRTVPLVSVPDGNKWILIASNWGGEKAPAWSFNLRKNPACTITCDGATSSFVAREVSGEEYEHYWQQAVALYSGYAIYKQRAAHRHIPVFVLEPI
jgi:deazaflavin-dependent oxidoreductase (nitroreductase family)